MKTKIKYIITEVEKVPQPTVEETAPSLGAAPEDPANMPEIITQAMNIFEGAKIIKKD